MKKSWHERSIWKFLHRNGYSMAPDPFQHVREVALDDVMNFQRDRERLRSGAAYASASVWSIRTVSDQLPWRCGPSSTTDGPLEQSTSCPQPCCIHSVPPPADTDATLAVRRSMQYCCTIPSDQQARVKIQLNTCHLLTRSTNYCLRAPVTSLTAHEVNGEIKT